MAEKKIPYVERDVSWMYFNYRILKEAEKESVPLLERLNFLGIYSNNLDEFFRVRVASLNRILLDDGINSHTVKIIKKTLRKINSLNSEYSVEYTAAVQEVFQGLEKHGIFIDDESHLDDAQKQFLTRFFYDKLNGSVNPIWISNIDDITTLEDNRIYLMVEEKESIERGKTEYAIVKIPDRTYGRWIRIPSDDGAAHIMYLDDVVRFCMPYIFIGLKDSTFRAFSFKFTKDAEMEIDNEADYGIMEKIAAGVDSRKRGEAVRIVYDSAMPPEMFRRIRKRLSFKELDTSLAGGRYQNHKDLMNFPNCGHKELCYPSWKHVMKPEFISSDSILEAIRRKDRFIHVPYHSFNGYIRVLREASIQPEVKSIKTTLYRLAKDSKVVKALINAARNGKKVTAVVELLARFDEESNIKWSKRMQEEGVNVIFGVEGLKIHSKLLLIESKRGNIACIGTGNFHEDNAKVYTDYIMMTARPKIVNEVEKVFRFIDRPFSPMQFRELMVSPNSMKSRILKLIATEIKNATEGRDAWMKIKINHITDPDIVKKLYEASKAGVKVDILNRGNCSLVPGVERVSENIRCVGIIDRYLEHSRILIFCNGGQKLYFLGSADWMQRNLSARIEVMTPVYDDDLKKDLLRTVEYGLNDTTNGWLVTGTGDDVIQSGRPSRSQEKLYEEYLKENEYGND
ncbi:MAG: RNA degradosome polyphosphate kinase [Bacteroidales bacterium]|nr:RNA degradosome polyphosphate kinase [Bacteroidales bacterium]MDY6001418.1 RNA degradosome polyphosphate kinase [Candidatus Cryptobacteroides sp.]